MVSVEVISYHSKEFSHHDGGDGQFVNYVLITFKLLAKCRHGMSCVISTVGLTRILRALKHPLLYFFHKDSYRSWKVQIKSIIPTNYSRVAVYHT